MFDADDEKGKQCKVKWKVNTENITKKLFLHGNLICDAYRCSFTKKHIRGVFKGRGEF